MRSRATKIFMAHTVHMRVEQNVSSPFLWALTFRRRTCDENHFAALIKGRQKCASSNISFLITPPHVNPALRLPVLSHPALPDFGLLSGVGLSSSSAVPSLSWPSATPTHALFSAVQPSLASGGFGTSLSSQAGGYALGSHSPPIHPSIFSINIKILLPLF